MDNRELERALIAVKNKLDLLDIKFQQIDQRLRKLQDDADYLAIDIEKVKDNIL